MALVVPNIDMAQYIDDVKCVWKQAFIETERRTLNRSNAIKFIRVHKFEFSCWGDVITDFTYLHNFVSCAMKSLNTTTRCRDKMT